MIKVDSRNQKPQLQPVTQGPSTSILGMNSPLPVQEDVLIMNSMTEQGTMEEIVKKSTHH